MLLKKICKKYGIKNMEKKRVGNSVTILLEIYIKNFKRPYKKN